PGVAAVARDVEPAAGAAAAQLPRAAAGLPHAGEDDSGVVRVDGYVRGAGVGVFEEHAVPGLAAVLRAIDSAFATWSKRLAKDRGEGDVRVARVHGHGADLGDLFPDVLPGLARVGALVDAVSRRHVSADIRLAAADVDDVRVGRCNGQ